MDFLRLSMDFLRIFFWLMPSYLTFYQHRFFVRIWDLGMSWRFWSRPKANLKERFGFFAPGAGSFLPKGFPGFA